jgi:hypothetical protein
MNSATQTFPTFSTISPEEKLAHFTRMFVGYYTEIHAIATLTQIVDIYQANMLKAYGPGMAHFINNGMRIGMDRIEANRG